MPKTISTITILMILVTGGCASSVQQVQRLDAIQVAEGESTKPVQLKRIVVDIDRGQVIGRQYAGLAAVPHGELVWRGGRLELSVDELTDIFRDELARKGYEVVGDPDALFDDPSSWKAELLVGGIVRDLEMAAIYPWAGYGNYTKSKGECFMTVEWQVFSRLDRQVVFSTTTSGTGVVDKARNFGVDDTYGDAFAVAVNNLLANGEFHGLVTAENPVIAEDIPAELAIPRTGMFTTPFSENSERIGSGVVTIFAGDGHGSGFLVSNDGYVLTNEHVVRTAKYVKLRFSTGDEVLGEVVKTHPRRDVALIKAESSPPTPLPILQELPRVGEDIFAIGTPLSEEFSTTVSRGVVSAIRDEDGLKLLQSDVNTQPGNSGGPITDSHGNVIGIHVSGISVSGAKTGLNFHIPIADALYSLGVSISE